MQTNEWPLSNYPIFFALVLLTATAITLAMGDEALAESLAVYAYYFLVIGVMIRFFELSLSDTTREKLKLATARLLKGTCNPAAVKYLSHGNVPKRMCNLNLSYKFTLKSIYSLKHTAVNLASDIRKISREVSANLTVLFVLICIYGLIFGWWIVQEYLKSLLVIIIVFLSVFLLMELVLRLFSVTQSNE